MRATKNAGSRDSKPGLADTMKLVIAVVFVAIFALLNITEPKPHQATLTVTETASALAPQTKQEQPKQDEPAVTTPAPETPAPAAVEPAPAVAAAPSKADPVPYGVHDIGGYGDCAAEIAKYDWGQSVAMAVMVAESQHRPGVINNTPSTGDYSIGCFQVNIAGANARTRPPQEQLIDAAVNVRWAYNNYVANGHSFIGQWGVCRSKVQCY